MFAILKPARIQNLVLIVLLQYFLRHFLIRPMMGSFGYELMLSNWSFCLLVIASVCIASAGYIMNDYSDQKELTPVNESVRKKNIALSLYLTLSGIGVLIGFYLAWQIHVVIAGLILLMAVGLIWFYITDYKRQLLIGNLIVGIFSILPILVVVLYEPQLFRVYVSPENGIAVLIFKVVFCFSFIVFLISLLYAILNDIRDEKANAALYYRTLPIVWGVNLAKVIFAGSALIIILLLAYIQTMQLANGAFVPFMYILFFIQIPILFSSVFLFLTNKGAHYRVIQYVINFVMIVSVFSLLILYYFPG